MLLQASALLEQVTFGMAVCLAEYTASPVRSSCSVSERRLAVARVVAVAVGLSRWVSVEIKGLLVCCGLLMSTLTVEGL